MNIQMVQGPGETIYIAPEVAILSMEEEKSFLACAYVVIPFTPNRKLYTRKERHPYRKGSIQRITSITGARFPTSLSAY
ncbi:MAG: hypothetical protein HAW62_00875 [Endozoicomonadaceae bacterium]|nr:hypothetical protein [Endozoicomonadaceae bacterium]